MVILASRKMEVVKGDSFSKYLSTKPTYPRLYHFIIEAREVSKSLLRRQKLTANLKKIIRDLDLKVKKRSYFYFRPQGTTMIFILSSSHLSVHTWPELNYLHIDLLTCNKISRAKIVTILKRHLCEIKKTSIKEINYNHD